MKASQKYPAFTCASLSQLNLYLFSLVLCISLSRGRNLTLKYRLVCRVYDELIFCCGMEHTYLSQVSFLESLFSASAVQVPLSQMETILPHWAH